MKYTVSKIALGTLPTVANIFRGLLAVRSLRISSITAGVSLLFASAAWAGNLKAPTGLAATAISSTQINLSWQDNSANETGTKIERANSSAGPWTQIATVGTQVISYANTGLNSSTTYYYRVRTYGSGGDSAYSSVASAVTRAATDTTAPSVPTGLTAVAASSSQINLAWNACSDTGGSGLAGYKIYRGGIYIASTTATSYSNTGLSSGTQYCYTVAAYDNAGNNSAPCAQACAVAQSSADTVAPSVPTGLAATAVSSSQINLSWNACSDTGGSGLAGYKIYRNGVYLTSTSATSYSNTGLTAGTQYCYKVAAYDNAANSSVQGSQVCSVTSTVAPSGGPWVQDFGSAGAESGRAVKVDGQGNIVVAGYFANTVDFGSGPLTSRGSYDLFVAKYSPAGVCQWAKSYGSTGTEFVMGLGLDPSGNIVVVGSFSGTSDFGGGLVTSAGANDIFVAKYSATGSYLWAKRYGSIADDTANGVAVDGSGNVLVTGGFVGSINLGGVTLNAAYAGMDSFVLKLSSAGAHVWSRNFTSTADDQGMSIAVDGSGNVFVTGYYAGLLNCGAGNFAIHGGCEVYVTKLHADTGTHLWSKSYGGTSADKPYGITVDPSGNVVVFGLFTGAASFGGTSLTALGGYDVFLAKYAGGDGSHQWSKSFGSGGSEWPNAVTTDASGNVIITGFFQLSMNLGGGTVLQTAGYQDIYVAKYSSSGAYIWGESFGGSSYDDSGAIAVDSTGHAIVTGYYYGTADFGGQSLTSAGSSDMYLMRLDP